MDYDSFATLCLHAGGCFIGILIFIWTRHILLRAWKVK